MRMPSVLCGIYSRRLFVASYLARAPRSVHALLTHRLVSENAPTSRFLLAQLDRARESFLCPLGRGPAPARRRVLQGQSLTGSVSTLHRVVCVAGPDRYISKRYFVQ